MGKNFWFKMEWEDWLNDDELSACTLETQGFWIRCLCQMYRADVAEITGTADQLRRKFGILPEELTRCLHDLKTNNAADVRFGNGDVSIVSRRRKKDLKAKESNRLYVARHREKDECKTDVRTQSIEIDKETDKEEEIREEPATPPPDPKPDRKMILPLDWKPSIDLLAWTSREAPGLNVSETLEDFLDFWRDIATRDNKRTLRGWDATWRKRVKDLLKQNGTPQRPLAAADRNWERTVANEQLGEDLRAGKLDGLLDELHRRDPLYRHQVAPPSESPAALTGGFDDYGEGLDGFSEADHPGAPFS
jgi:hypothetical protein